jgi:FdhD protein
MTHSPQLVDETATSIVINGVSYAVMLASNNDLEDFVIGFLFTEGIINGLLEVQDIEVIQENQGILIQVELANRSIEKLKRQQRSMRGVSGCGLCGKVALQEAFPVLTPLKISPLPDLNRLQEIKSDLAKHQQIAAHSGAMHGAFWLDTQLAVLACREDIGRHNALDKLIGLALRSQLNNKNSTIVVTSRCGAELVQKTVCMGVSNLVSLASPSTLAVEMASAHHLNLIQLRKRDAPIIFCGGSSSEQK